MVMKVLGHILLLFVFFSLIPCNSKQKKATFDEKLIQLISEDLKYPSYETCLFFVQGENGKIIKLEPWELKKMYDKDYSSWNYKDFIRKALNQEIIFKRKITTFQLNRNVMNNYLNYDFEDFIKLYCRNRLDGAYILNNKVPEDEKNSVFYYCFVNNYLTEFDDGIGVYFLFKTSEYTNKK